MKILPFALLTLLAGLAALTLAQPAPQPGTNSADPIDILSNVELAFIDGCTIDLENKQTKLAEKYREKYRQLGLIEDNE